MPNAAPRPCREPGCPALVHGRAGRCPQHARPKAPGARDWYRARGGMFWFGLRRTVRERQGPCCPECQAEGVLTPWTEVHHIVPLKDGGANEVANLVGLCKSHHSAHTARERRGAP